jgi:crotonobetainyl-CoA:carnitine CoA-transferase CaiB-like acyl-CoA transferase
MTLSGIRVLELGVWAAAPSASAILGDWGAEVIKIENPNGGDPCRGILHTGGVFRGADFNQQWELLNRNKRSLALDITKDQGREVVYKIVTSADVFISNLRPTTLARLAYDYDTLSNINPRLIYCLVLGYGTAGPGKDWPAFDETAYWASSGLMSILGEPDSPPPMLHGAMGDLPTGMFAAGGIALALYHRERTGKGQKVAVSLLGSGAWTVAFDLQTALYYNYDSPRESRKDKINPLFNSYQTKDKRWIMLAMPQSELYWPRFCQAIGRTDLEADPQFNTHERRVENSKLLISILDEVMTTITLTELSEKFRHADLVWAPVQTLTEVANDPNMIMNQYIVEYVHPSRGKVRGISSPVNFSDTPAVIRNPAPELGQDTEEILLEIGYNWDEIQQMKDNKVIL